jgi:hypothetical protein
MELSHFICIMYRNRIYSEYIYLYVFCGVCVIVKGVSCSLPSFLLRLLSGTRMAVF